MAGYTNTDTLFMQSEVVRPKLQEWRESFMVASNLIKKTEVQRVGERDYRVPVKLSSGGRAGTYDPNNGDLGRGTSLSGNVLISTFFPTRINFELPDLKIDATENSEVAVKSAFKEAVKDAVKELAVNDDIFFHTDGTAVAGTATAQATVSSKTVYTLDTTFGIQRIRRGGYYAVYSSDYSTLRGTFQVTKIDYPNKKVTMSQTISGAASTDVLCFDGVSGTGAAPAWKQGLYYGNSYATSGTFLGIDRSTEPEVIVNSVNVNGVVTPNHGLLLLDQMGQRRGEVGNVVGLANTPQRAQIYSQQVALSEWMRGKSDGPMDIMPKVSATFPFVGVNHTLDYRQDRSRIDWIATDTWGRARLFDVKYYEKGGVRFFPIYGSSGAPAATTWFSMIQAENFVPMDPGSNGVLYGCTQPAGY